MSDAEDRRPCISSNCTTCFAAVLYLSLLVAIGFFIWFYGLSSALRHVLSFIPEDPGWGWTCTYCVITSVCIITLTPLWPPLCVGAGLIFGFWWGALANFFSIYGAALGSISIGRWLLREPVRNCIEGGSYNHLRLMISILEDDQESIKLQVLFRFLFLPMFIRNYAPATLEIPIWKLFVSAIPHSIWISIMFASLGATFKDTAELVRDGNDFSLKGMKWQHLLIYCVSLAVMIFLSVYAWTKYEERKSQEDATNLTKERTEKSNDVERIAA